MLSALWFSNYTRNCNFWFRFLGVVRALGGGGFILLYAWWACGAMYDNIAWYDNWVSSQLAYIDQQEFVLKERADGLESVSFRAYC